MVRLTAESFKPYVPKAERVTAHKKSGSFMGGSISKLTRDDIERVKMLYEELTAAETAKELKVGITTLRNFMSAYGIPRRTGPESYMLKNKLAAQRKNNE